tara:strand:+ start:657 stop:1061 length:405 start_codon:yes stop_codon:yes gene_type:complete
MATTAAEALSTLGITEWVLRGEPSNEDEFNDMFTKVTGADSNGSAIESSDPDDFGVTWKQVSDKMKEMDDAAPMNELRRQRNEKLAETDFYALSDVTMSSDMADYREDLRDLPATAKPTLTDGVLGNVTWPTKP